MLIQYRTGDMFCPKINPTEALGAEVDHIIECLGNNHGSVASTNTKKSGLILQRQSSEELDPPL